MDSQNIARLDYYIDKIYRGSKEENIIDALADTMHMAARHGVDFEDSLWMARKHFERETNLTDELTNKVKVSDEDAKLFYVEVRNTGIRSDIRDLEKPPDGLYLLLAADTERALQQFNAHVSFGSREDFVVVISETTPMEIVDKLESGKSMFPLPSYSVKDASFSNCKVISK